MPRFLSQKKVVGRMKKWRMYICDAGKSLVLAMTSEGRRKGKVDRLEPPKERVT